MQELNQEEVFYILSISEMTIQALNTNRAFYVLKNGNFTKYPKKRQQKKPSKKCWTKNLYKCTPCIARPLAVNRLTSRHPSANACACRNPTDPYKPVDINTHTVILD